MTSEGLWRFHVEAWSRPDRDAGITMRPSRSRPARTWSWCSPRAHCCSTGRRGGSRSRPEPAARPRPGPRCGRWSRFCATAACPGAAARGDRGPRHRGHPGARSRCVIWSTRSRALAGAGRTGRGRCTGRGTSSSRAPKGARRPDGPDAAGLGHVRAPRPSGCPRSPRWASTSSTCRRSTRSARSTARARTTPSTRGPAIPGSPWAIGSRRRRPRRDPPGPRHARGLRRFVGRGARARHGGRARPGAAVRARPPVGDGAPRVVHDPGRRLHRLRREPAEEVPGHLPDQLRQRPTRASTPRSCGSCGTGSATGSRSSGWTTRTPSRCGSGSG